MGISTPPPGLPDADAPAAEATAPSVVMLTEPADGIPPVVETPEALAAVVAAFGAGTGPVAVDAERASGYRYGQRTYLVQIRREGAGTALIDPIAVPDLSSLSDALVGVEWVLHAASQDLPGLAEQGMRPSRVFDTELGARLLGLERVGLAAVVADALGLGLAKEHSAVDWSTRPLPSRVAPLRGARRRGAGRAARGAGRAAGRRRQGRVGRAGVRGRPHRTAAPAAGRALAPGLRPARDPRRPPARASSASSG